MKRGWVLWVVGALVLVAGGIIVFGLLLPYYNKTAHVIVWDELPSLDIYADLERYGGWEQTRAAYDSALSSTRAQGESEAEWHMLLKIGILHESCGNLDSAQIFLEHGLQFARNRAGRALAALRLGILYGKLGDVNRAEKYFEMACALYPFMHDSSLYDPARPHFLREHYFFHRANLFFMQDSFAAAASHYQQALSLYQHMKHSRGEWACCISLGAVHAQQGDSVAALHWYDRADSSSWGRREAYALAVNALQRGELYRQLGKTNAALQSFRTARERLEGMNGRDLETAEVDWQSRLGEARCWWALGNRQQARRSAEASVQVLEQRTLRVASDAMKRSYLEHRREAFAEVVGINLALRQYSEAMAAAERGRSRAFLDLLQERGIHLRAADEDSLAALRRNQRQQQLLASLEGSDASAALGLRPRGERAVSTEHEGAAPAQNLSPELRSLSSVLPVTFDAMVRLAREKKTTLLQYFVMADSLAIFLITPRGKFRCRTVRVSSDSLGRVTARLLRYIAAAPARAASWRQAIPIQASRSINDVNHGVVALRQIYDWLISPIAAELPADTNEVVTIVPHGVLFLTPFPALLDGHGRYLVEKHSLATVPSAGVLQFTGQKRGVVVSPRDPYVLVAGDPAYPPDRNLQPLLGARAEAKGIASMFVADRVHALQGSQASESEIKKLAPAFTIMHFATHGLLDESDPMLSALAFASDSLNDGFLTCAEIFVLPQLHADLVVLSACQTGRGAITGDGILGLSRAFLYAGTPALIATQWSIDDESTSYLIREFYAEYRRTGRKALALRAAQTRTLKKYPPPYYWAAFVLIGED